MTKERYQLLIRIKEDNNDWQNRSQVITALLDRGKPNQIKNFSGPILLFGEEVKSVWVFVKGSMNQIRGFSCVFLAQNYSVRPKAISRGKGESEFKESCYDERFSPQSLGLICLIGFLIFFLLNPHESWFDITTLGWKLIVITEMDLQVDQPSRGKKPTFI